MTFSTPPILGVVVCSKRFSLLEMKARCQSRRGFSLVELLVVLGIMAILASIFIFSISGTNDSRNLTYAAYDTQGVLEQARTFAMANNTYVWVGLFEEDPATPGVAGKGQVVIAIVSSVDGTKLYSASNPLTQLPSASLTQVTKLLRLPNLHLDELTAPTSTTTTTPTFTTRPAVSSNTYQISDTTFPNGTSFVYPLSGPTQYTFTHIIQFSPQGDATRIGDTPTQIMEIGLRPSHGNQVTTTNPNVIALQISGIGGRVAMYRP